MTLPENKEIQTYSPPSKRIKLDETSHTNRSSDQGLLSFCDDILLEIFSHLRPTDLFALSQCCQRLQRLILDRTLWVIVDFRPVRLSESDIRKYIKYFLPNTKIIALRGVWNMPLIAEVDRDPQEREEQEPTFTANLLQSITQAAPNLTTLILENHVIDSQDLTLGKVPSTLEHLSFRSCLLTNLDSTKSFFYGIDTFLPDLKVLDLSQCRWFESHSFLALSKLQQLKELRLADCLLDDCVPYISLGTRFGFQALTIVDLRRTWISDREVSCFNKTSTLQELYLESPGGEGGSMLISDVGVTAFGGSQEEWNKMGYLVVQMDQDEVVTQSSLRVIEMCNYRGITDTSLRHCASCLKGLQHLNFKGTSCTKAGIIKFKSQRPDVIIKSSFDVEINIASCRNIDSNT